MNANISRYFWVKSICSNSWFNKSTSYNSILIDSNNRKRDSPGCIRGPHRDTRKSIYSARGKLTRTIRPVFFTIMTSTNEIAYIIKREHTLIYERKPHQLTPDDWGFLREQGIINGCGAKTGPFANFRPPCAEFFEANCDWHDHGYKKGGGIFRKFVVDYKFFMAQIRDIWRSSKPWWYKIYLYAWAVLYYIAVTIFWWPSYTICTFPKKTYNLSK